MSLSQYQIQKYCQDFDVETYLYNYGCDFDEHSEQEIRLTECPECGKEKKCFVRKDNKIYHCYRCEI